MVSHCGDLCVHGYTHTPFMWECGEAYVTGHAWKSENNFTWSCPLPLCVLKLRALGLAVQQVSCPAEPSSLCFDLHLQDLGKIAVTLKESNTIVNAAKAGR